MKAIGIISLLCLWTIILFNPIEQVLGGEISFDMKLNYLDIPSGRADYTYGVGNIDDDSDKEIVVRVWSKKNGKDYDFQSRIFAFDLDGTKLFEFNTKATLRRFGLDYCAMAPLTIWDFDGDGKDEVVTIEVHGDEMVDLVMLEYDGSTTPKKKRTVRLEGNPQKFIFGTLAFLTGDKKKPYMVVAYGRNSRVYAYDADFSAPKYKFDKAEFYKQYDCVYLRAYDFDDDGRDEIIHGPLLLNEDLSLYLDGTALFDQEYQGVGQTERSFVADIDPYNPGYEWYFQRLGGGNAFRSEGFHEPKDWKGPYLVDIDERKILWHHKGDETRKSGWGWLHRGWIGNVRPDRPGIEMFATGEFWDGQSDWENRDENYEKPETWFLFDYKGRIIEEEDGTFVGYPILWDDDAVAEYYQYRSGTLRSEFDKNAAKLNHPSFTGHIGSGECTITDFLGDWREEIIVADNSSGNHILHVYYNSDSNDHPTWPNLWKSHNYRLHQASIGSGLPKPWPPDADWQQYHRYTDVNIIEQQQSSEIKIYPNPFNATVSIAYSTPSKAKITVEVFNVRGEKVETLVNKRHERGNYKINWNAGGQTSGLYLIKISIGEKTQIKRALFLK